jgi:hypothetical protein
VCSRSERRLSAHSVNLISVLRAHAARKSAALPGSLGCVAEAKAVFHLMPRLKTRLASLKRSTFRRWLSCEGGSVTAESSLRKQHHQFSEWSPHRTKLTSVYVRASLGNLTHPHCFQTYNNENQNAQNCCRCKHTTDRTKEERFECSFR